MPADDPAPPPSSNASKLDLLSWVLGRGKQDVEQCQSMIDRAVQTSKLGLIEKTEASDVLKQPAP